LGRNLAIGDIHGCLTALTTLIEAVGPQHEDTIITLGDYVDRGPDVRAVVDFVLDLRQRCNVVSLRGNHEIMMLDARDQQSWFGPWKQYGGEAALESYGGSFDGVPDEHLQFLEHELVSHHETDTHIFVHANLDAEKALDAQSDAALYWRKYRKEVQHCSGKTMVCGHTAQVTGLPRAHPHSICIDTWPYGEGWLSCLDATSGTIWQANQKGEQRQLHLDQLPPDDD